MLSCFLRVDLDEILDLIESVSECFPTYSTYSSACYINVSNENALLIEFLETDK